MGIFEEKVPTPIHQETNIEKGVKYLLNGNRLWELDRMRIYTDGIKKDSMPIIGTPKFIAIVTVLRLQDSHNNATVTKSNISKVGGYDILVNAMIKKAQNEWPEAKNLEDYLDAENTMNELLRDRTDSEQTQ